MNNTDIIILKWISINKNISNKLHSSINILNFLRSNILSLTQFINIFFSINYLQSSIWKDNANISWMIPSIAIYCLFCILRIFIINLKNWITSNAYLSFWRIRLTCIVHFRYIYKFKLSCWVRPTNMSIIYITFISHKTCSHCLGLTISFS